MMIVHDFSEGGKSYNNNNNKEVNAVVLIHVCMCI